MSTVGVTKASWIASKWKQGWVKIPVLMAVQCLTVPMLIGYILAVSFSPEFRKGPSSTKYRATYTVMRSDDPRVKNINNYSSWDKKGIFS